MAFDGRAGDVRNVPIAQPQPRLGSEKLDDPTQPGTEHRDEARLAEGWFGVEMALDGVARLTDAPIQLRAIDII